jgi:hypothetical protein
VGGTSRFIFSRECKGFGCFLFPQEEKEILVMDTEISELSRTLEQVQGMRGRKA